jgi:acetyl-CoA acetyltransferase
MTDAFVLGGVRTPIGRYGGSLSHLRVDDLLGRAMVWARERVGVPLDPARRDGYWRPVGLGVCVGSGQGVALVLENPKAA